MYEDVVAGGIVLPPSVVSKNDLGARIVGIASVTQEFGDVLDVLVAAPEFVLASSIVNANEERFLL
jgi:hypothetical protein